jgi:hypothetical protein
MSFDKPTRNKLASMVGDCRNLLTDDIRHQLQAVYGLQPDGSALAVSSLAHLDERGREVASALRLWQEHLGSTEPGTDSQKRKAAFDRLAHETAFTVLNRLAALRMCEERGHVIECVRRGMESDGFVLYERFSEGVLGGRGETYRVFLERMFAELSVDLGALFDLDAPQSLVFPRERCLEEVLSLLNRADLVHLWKEDETIGWIYQYFNSREEREAMREASAAPRNSRELAVRNQFFTPRYVVEFLGDNTLGRIWYEMRHGETALKESCRYLLRRPTEIFVEEGQQPPSSATTQDSLTQDELLKQRVYVPHREKRDPRTLKILDPAVGSGHFLLYAFDLLEVIYQEAWEEKAQPIFEATGKTLREEYGDLKALRIALPELILRHNLHGIDIDLRACQIAALALWLRSQHGYQHLGLKSSQRPRIKRSNVVCAEPMPGEQGLLDQFLTDLQPKVIGQLVQAVFEKMKLAGEAGSLLKVEVEIADAVGDAKQKWLAGPNPEQGLLFADLAHPEQKELELDFSGITDETFWEKAEERIYVALQMYAEQAENGNGYQRRLFADDAERGFAFIDLCRSQYDVILMNPPFGEASLKSREYLYHSTPEAARDLFAGFVSRFNDLLKPRGRLGVLSNRTAFFSDFLASWRVANFLGDRACLALVGDLGYGVLDAVVEAAVYVCEKTLLADCLFFNVLNSTDKQEQLLEQLTATHAGQNADGSAIRRLDTFRTLPDNRFLYQLQPFWIERLNIADEHPLFICKSGLATGDNIRNLRLFWEVTALDITKRWKWLAKGGEFSRYRTAIHLLVDWQNREHLRRLQNSDLYGTAGVTYTERTTSNLSARVLNDGAYFSGAGPGAIPRQAANVHFLLAYMNSFITSYYIESIVGGGDFSLKGTAARHLEPGYMTHIPVAEVSLQEAAWFKDKVNQLIHVLDHVVADETDALFTCLLLDRTLTLTQSLTTQTRQRFQILEKGYQLVESLETRLTHLLAFPSERSGDAFSDTGWPWPQNTLTTPPDTCSLLETDPLKPNSDLRESKSATSKYRYETKLFHYLHSGVEREALSQGVSPAAICRLLAERATPRRTALIEYVAAVISYLFGCAFGRWDMRYATGETSVQELPDPFAPLPACPPGLLQNERGLPLTKTDLQDLQAAGLWHYPLDIPWDGILVDDVDNVNDIVRRVREVLTIIWKDRAEPIEQEVSDVLEVEDVREYLRKPSLFFADHLKRCSKSRRQAPIYWPLSNASGSYTLWVYYHRLNDDSLYTALNRYVKPKIDDTEKQLRRIESELPNATGREVLSLRTALEETKVLVDELREFRDELARIADLPYKPNLNDGVLITASPLWKLFRLPKWRNDLQQCWKELEAGHYDWAHLAYAIWPDRVRDACKSDRSIAIAHELESLCEIAAKPAKKKRSKKIAVQETVPGDEE